MDPQRLRIISIKYYWCFDLKNREIVSVFHSLQKVKSIAYENFWWYSKKVESLSHMVKNASEYRSRQSHESKVLHSTDLTVFFTAHHFQRKNNSNIKYQRISLPHLLCAFWIFDTFGTEISRFYCPKSVIKVPWEIEFWAILFQNGLKSQFLRKLE